MWDKIAQSIDNEIDKGGIRSLFYDFENNEGNGLFGSKFSDDDQSAYRGAVVS